VRPLKLLRNQGGLGGDCRDARGKLRGVYPIDRPVPGQSVGVWSQTRRLAINRARLPLMLVRAGLGGHFGGTGLEVLAQGAAFVWFSIGALPLGLLSFALGQCALARAGCVTLRRLRGIPKGLVGWFHSHSQA
jgi:hypothetical protein